MAVTKKELSDTINPLFQNLSDKIDHISELLGKDIETLKKQSAEHYIKAEKLNEKIKSEVEKAKKDCDNSIAGIGERVGTLEQVGAAKDIEIDSIKTRLDKKSNNTRWRIDIWIVLIVAIGVPVLLKYLGMS